MVALQSLPANSDQAVILAAVDEDGACIVTDLLDESVCDELLSDFQPHLEQIGWGVDELGYRNEFYGSQTKRLHGLFSKSVRMEAVHTHPDLLKLARGLLVEGGSARDLRLSNTELMVLGQHQGNQVFHSDAGSWHHAQAFEKAAGREVVLSANIALTAFTATNGATRVVPRSHRWPAGREPRDEEVCLAVMPRGAALIYNGNVLHSGGENKEAQTRTGLYLGYVVSWLRPIENYLVTNRPEDIFALAPEARQLLDVSPGGFTVYA